MKKILKITHPMSQALIYESVHLGSHGINYEQLLITIPYNIDPDQFEKAWRYCFLKHPAILAEHNLKANTTEFELTDASGNFFEFIHVGANEELAIQTVLEQDRKQKKSLTDQTVSVKLYRINENQFHCLFCFHHAVMDGTSIAVVIKDVFDCYTQLNQGEAIPAPEQDPSYLSHLDRIAEIDHESSKSYWQEHLDGYTGAIRPEIFESANNAEKSKKVSAKTLIESENLASLADATNCRINNIFQVAWALLIARYCDAQDIVFGAVRACRSSTEHQNWNTVGMFMNIVPQRFILDKELSVAQLLTAAREQQLAHKPYENTPITHIANAAKVPTTDLLGSLLMYTEQPLNGYFLENNQWSSCTVELFEQSSFPLELIVYSGKNIEVKIEGDASLYSNKAIDSMLASLLFIIQQMVNSPSMIIDDVDLMPVNTANSIIFQNAPLSSSKPQSFLNKIERTFEQSGHRLAITEGEEQYSYERIDTLSRNVASYLINGGIKKGDIVAISMGRSAKSIITQIGVLRAGAAFISINDNDPAERNAFIVADSKAKYLVCDLDEASFTTPDICKKIKFTDITQASASQSHHPEVHLSSSDIAYIIYTSGTTGKPKGVAISHGNLDNHISSIKGPYGVTKSDHILQFASHTFDVAIEEIYLSLASCAHLVIRDEFCISSANSFIDFIAEHNITVLNIPTAFWHFLVERMGNKLWPNSIRLLIVGGEEPTLAALKKWRKQNTQHIRWMNAYGPTETTITSTLFEDSADKPLKAGSPIPIGTPLQNVTHYILDSRKKPLPIGCAGQLYIGGLGVASGYLNRPELTQEKFPLDPFIPDLKMYASGDKAYLKADGNFVYLGRSDTQVKVRGFRVELGELENTCLLHPHITGCVAEKPKGEDSLTIYIISTHEHIAEEIIQFLKKRLPPYAIPSKVKVVEDIPLTTSGKLSRKNLHELKLIDEAKVKTDDATPPRDDTERKLLSIWNDHLPEAIISVNKSFFEAGGHSLLAVQVFSDIEDEFDTTIDIRRFFGEPTIAWLAAEIRGQQKNTKIQHKATQNNASDNQASVITLQAEGDGIPIYCICGIEIYRALASSLGTEQPVYGVFLPVEAEMIERFSQGRDFQLPSVGEMAQSYVDAIINNTPDGPVGLAGVSFGGLLAFEIAQQLKARGREVAHLTLMESFLSRAMQRKGYIEWVLEHAIYYLKNPGLIKSTLQKSLISLQMRKSQLGIDSMDDIANVDFGELRWKAYHHAANKYDTEICTYNGNVTLFKAEQQPPRLGLHVDSTYGWANLIKGELEIFTVPGDHLGVLVPPNVGILARKLMPKIKSANQLNIRL